MFLLINTLYFPLKYYGIHLGYSKGKDLLSSSNGKKILDRITTSANVLGVMVAGALITSTVGVNLGVSFGKGEGKVMIQDMLDKVLPNMLPLLLTLLCLYFIKKWNGKHVVAIIFALIAVAIVLSYFKILV